jgi:phospholipid/cholesterol/gamma-HCH transport system permease protein
MAILLEKTKPDLQLDPKLPNTLLATGDWTFQQAENLLQLVSNKHTSITSINILAIERLDATGSKILLSLIKQLGIDDTLILAKPEHKVLIDKVRASSEQLLKPKLPESLLHRTLESTGKWVVNGYQNTLLLISFLGQTILSFVSSLFTPKHWRITSVVFHMQAVGLNAVPLVMLLSFMIGAVVAFLGATVLREFGAELYVVELVGVSFMREFGVLLTAIILAGRTASAFTAQIGSMKSGEEIDALRTMGLDPIELLVLPRIKALLLTLPLLAFLATMAGLLGGMLVCKWNLDISPEMFINRLNTELSPRHIWIGLSKAPIFAVVIGLIGCLEGFKVKNSAQSVGEHTTSSVVQSIALVILLDALAAMFFMELDL